MSDRPSPPLRLSVVLGAVGVGLSLFLASAVLRHARPQAGSSAKPAWRLSVEQLGSTGFQRLMHERMAEKLLVFSRLLKSFSGKHGALPSSLRELEPELAGMPEAGILRHDFYLIVEDAAPDYGYVYRPAVPELPLIALPRDVGAGLLSLGLDDSLLHVAGQTAGRLPSEPLASLFLMDLYQALNQPRSVRSTGPEFTALWGLWSLREAQSSYARLHGGVFAQELGELTRTTPPARFPLLDAEDLEPQWPSFSAEAAARHPESYRVRFGVDAAGWWAEAAPENLDPRQACAQLTTPPLDFLADGRGNPSAHQAPCRRFRVAQAQPLAYAELGGEPSWRPITELAEGGGR